MAHLNSNISKHTSIIICNELNTPIKKIGYGVNGAIFKGYMLYNSIYIISWRFQGLEFQDCIITWLAADWQRTQQGLPTGMPAHGISVCLEPLAA